MAWIREERHGGACRQSQAEQPTCETQYETFANALAENGACVRSECEPTSVVQPWASEGMPLRRQGRFVTTTPDELSAWLGKESGKPVYVATESTDLTAELKRGLLFVRGEKPKNHASQPRKRKS